MVKSNPLKGGRGGGSGGTGGRGGRGGGKNEGKGRGNGALNAKKASSRERTISWKEKLFSAAQSGDIDMFEAVLAGGAPIDTPIGSDLNNTTHVQNLNALLENVGSPVKWDTPLIVASRRGHINIVNLCLKAGAKNDPFGEGTTALHAAVAARQVSTAEVILQSAAKAQAAATICDILDSSGNTPLHLAAKIAYEMAKTIGLDDDDVGSGNASGNNGTDSQLMELLISHGADTRIRDSSGNTCLHISATAGSISGIECLLEYDDGLIDLVDKAGSSALHITVAKNDINTVRVLLQSAANPYLKSIEKEI